MTGRILDPKTRKWYIVKRNWWGRLSLVEDRESNNPHITSFPQDGDLIWNEREGILEPFKPPSLPQTPWPKKVKR